MESWLVAVNIVGRHAASRCYIQVLTCQHVNEWKTGDHRCMLYSVYAVLGGCCTWCILDSVYVVLSVNSWRWCGELVRGHITLGSAMIREVWMRKKDGGWRWEWYGEYECIAEICGIVELIGSTDITMPRTMMKLASFVVITISHRSTLCRCDKSRYTIQ